MTEMSTGEIRRKLGGGKQHHSIHNKKLRRESIHSQNDSTNTMSFEIHKDHMRSEDDRYTHFTNDVTKTQRSQGPNLSVLVFPAHCTPGARPS